MPTLTAIRFPCSILVGDPLRSESTDWMEMTSNFAGAEGGTCCARLGSPQNPINAAIPRVNRGGSCLPFMLNRRGNGGQRLTKAEPTGRFCAHQVVRAAREGLGRNSVVGPSQAEMPLENRDR